jgi:hypothetical protein
VRAATHAHGIHRITVLAAQCSWLLHTGLGHCLLQYACLALLTEWLMQVMEVHASVC